MTGQSDVLAEVSLGGRQPDLRLELVSNPVYLCGARELVAQISRRLGFDEHASSQIALALDEALANVIRHGYESREDGRIWVSFFPLAGQNASAAGIEIVVEDEARQVDPLKIKGRDLEDIRPGGLGVHIIREVMDEVRYEKRGERGMRLTMIKRHTPGAGNG